MTVFIIIATLLVLAVMARLLLPLWRLPKATLPVQSANERREANLAIFHDQLAELDREHRENLLSDADLAQSKLELKRRLLEDVQAEDADGSGRPAVSSSRKSALVLLIALPLAAIAGYALLGNPRALDPLQTQARSRVTPEQIEAMVGKLSDKLKQNPDDAKGWVMLARSYKALGRFTEAEEAYSHAGPVVDKDAVLLADYAEIIAQNNKGDLQGKPSEMLARALQIDPDEPQALLLAGAAASDRRDFATTATHWSRLLAQLEPGTEEAEGLKNAVEKARELATQRSAPDGKPTAAGPGISGEVVLSAKLSSQIKPDDVLFVFARAEDGQRMPLAVLRGKAGDLPIRFHFDDSMALPGGKKISAFKTVSIEARIAKAGKAETSSGDLFGNVSGVKLGKQGIRLTIDQVQP
jgi:cytochrome c-type biogenesis protein CcmH